MADLFVSLVAIAGFTLALWATRIVEVVKSLTNPLLESMSAILNRELSDLEKEAIVRRTGLVLLGKIVILVSLLLLALATFVFIILIADIIGIASRASVTDFMLRLDFILILTIGTVMVAFGYARIARRGQPPSPSGKFEYSKADRFVHKIAFSSNGLMKALAAFDDRLFKRTIDRIPDSTPIFVTSLARGGTTALLNACHSLPDVATHEYRDMPFLTAPILWSKVSGKRSLNVRTRERAHGDGLTTNLDSPEAFEEILWRLFWPKKYQRGIVHTWQEFDTNCEAQRVFSRHFAKIRVLRSSGGDHLNSVRYVSKNNANIGRLAFLRKVFPGCQIIVVLREPSAHAASLLRQHENFSKLQGEDDFVRQYMSDIGHFEFGLSHRPIAFDGFDPQRLSATTPDYWLDYWIAAFQEVERQMAAGTKLIIVTQAILRSAPQKTMNALCSELGVFDNSQDFTVFFRQGADQPHDELFSPSLLKKARDLYGCLQKYDIGIRTM